ncbi:hypothetical protein FL966_01780 [Caproiciproducens galactitolivorans]|uniref:HK97 gp10 family phage protein n=1 Tax=Caproiciproducens galactitolivorans TaxID=642589 RepID=A0A4Z0Y904_9FIRM|nr:hypothetical protein [Caproiciproducens galactitolivorans]QEY33873.1 hypothetical protein FL966_01780 [Caproiciproducens galactitolivorans]TGJ75383.1 hypothetical protein CAGA_24820 [Caproiciproducens galactitolivorans]
MSYRKCTPEEFEEALNSVLAEYANDVTAGVKKAVDIVGDEVNQTIKAHITFKQHTGDYVKSFRVAKTYEDVFRKTKTWYVKAPHYRLTHLLENGHALRQGGRARAFPHIKYGQEIAEARMMQLAKEAAENGGH